MTKQEFLLRKKQADSSSKRFSMFYLPAFFLILIGNLFLVKRVPKEYSWLYLIAFFSLLFANLFFTLWLERRRIDKFDLRCSHCKKPLTKSAAQIAVATGNCGNCGEHLFN